MTFTAVDGVVFPGPAGATAAVGEARSDMRQRAIVDHAIAVLGSSSMMSAFEYLRTHDVGAQVIERVLLEPLRRSSAA